MAQQQSNSTGSTSRESLPPPDVRPSATEQPRQVFVEQRRPEREYVEEEEQPLVSPVKPARRTVKGGKGKEKVKAKLENDGEESNQTAADYSRTKKDNHVISSSLCTRRTHHSALVNR